MAPEPRLGFEMTLLRMLAFRPEADTAPADLGQSASRGPSAKSNPPRERAVPTAVAAPTPKASQAPPAPAVVPAARAAAPVAPVPAEIATIDASNWLGIVDAAQLTGMVRQFALNCVPASFIGGLLSLRLDAAAADRRTKQIEEKLLLALVKYLGRDIRLNIETAESALATPARQRAIAEQDRVSFAAAAFEDDPAVRGLRERFGAEIDTASVKPGN
jgi:DNA polymerase-3 subunit gamma/tau